MKIGIPKETIPGERRVAATPKTVSKFIEAGFEVTVENGAGGGIFASDADYREAGAIVVDDTEKVFGEVDLVLKVKQPAFNEEIEKHEANMVRSGAILITFLHPANPAHHQLVETLRKRMVTSFTMDGIPRITRAQTMDALTSMSTVTGYKSVLNAACRLPRFVPMMGTAVGMLKPASILVVGVGVVGLQAIATAKRLGGTIMCFDIRPEAREEGKSLGAKVGGFEVPAEMAKGEGGYALALPQEILAREREALATYVKDADIVILSALVANEVAPILVTKEMISTMQPGSIVVDVSIDQGGNCDATNAGSEVEIDGVVVSGVQNIPGSVPVHATHMYATNIFNYVENMFKNGQGKIDWNDEIVRSSLVTREGRILHAGTIASMGLPAVSRA